MSCSGVSCAVLKAVHTTCLFNTIRMRVKQLHKCVMALASDQRHNPLVEHVASQ